MREMMTTQEDKAERISTKIERLSKQAEKLKENIEKCDEELYFSDKSHNLTEERRALLIKNKSKYEEELKIAKSKLTALRFQTVKTTIVALIITVIIMLLLHYYQLIDLRQFTLISLPPDEVKVSSSH